MIPGAIKNEIFLRLSKIEKEENVRILYCIESGSRAWGFPSTDSDFDVRFVYIHRPEWYLSIDLGYHRDVIEQPIIDEIDLNGWDIRKALLLFSKSNPPLLEWLASPIIYREEQGFADTLRALIPAYCSPIACMHHYLSMAKRNCREYMQGPEVRLKKYFYILRPLLAILWIERYQKFIPMEFSKLLTVIENQNLREEIEKLIAQKKASEELSTGAPIPAISQFIELELERLENHPPVAQKVHSNLEDLNNLFRRMLRKAWE